MQKKQPPIKLKSAQTKNNQLNSSFNSTSHCNSNAQHDINANVSTIGKICCGNGANVKDNVNITPSNLSLSYPQLNQSPVVECSSSTLPLSVAIPSFTPPPIAVLSNRGSNTHRKNIIMMPPPTPIVNMPDHLHSN